MTTKIKRLIFVHSYLNPPSEELDCNIDIFLEKPIGKINLEKVKNGFQTQYSLIINEKSTIGVDNHRRRPMNAIRDLVLALNLNLQRTCFSIRQGGMPNTETIRSPSKAKMEKTPKGPRITISETLGLTSRINLTIGSKETVSEEEAINILNKIVLVNRFETKLNLKCANLSKALNEYENAMHPSDRLTIFRNLYASIEFCVNWSGTDYKGHCLDSKIASNAEIEELTARTWRELYNRTKHVDRKMQHIEISKQTIDALPSILPQIREVATKLIIKRLNQIAKNQS